MGDRARRKSQVKYVDDDSEDADLEAMLSERVPYRRPTPVVLEKISDAQVNVMNYEELTSILRARGVIEAKEKPDWSLNTLRSRVKSEIKRAQKGEGTTQLLEDSEDEGDEDGDEEGDEENGEDQEEEQQEEEPEEEPSKKRRKSASSARAASKPQPPHTPGSPEIDILSNDALATPTSKGNASSAQSPVKQERPSLKKAAAVRKLKASARATSAAATAATAAAAAAAGGMMSPMSPPPQPPPTFHNQQQQSFGPMADAQ